MPVCQSIIDMLIDERISIGAIYAKMGHEMPRQYVDVTPAEVLYSSNILGSRAIMIPLPYTVLRQPRLESTAYNQISLDFVA